MDEFKGTTIEELVEYIESVLSECQDYNSAVDSVTLVTLAAFNFAARELGVTGFQASCAELSFLDKSRRIKGPFALVRAESMLYPQYDIEADVAEYVDAWLPWAAKEARKLLEEDKGFAAPQVKAHWEMLADIAESE